MGWKPSEEEQIEDLTRINEIYETSLEELRKTIVVQKQLLERAYNLLKNDEFTKKCHPDLLETIKKALS